MQAKRRLLIFAATARTCDEQIPRIFPGNAVHVAATFCDQLRNRQPGKSKKLVICGAFDGGRCRD
jgi:hypothetical protein